MEVDGRFAKAMAYCHNDPEASYPALAATFVVDGHGTITYAFVTADFTLRAEPTEVVKVLESMVK